MDERILVELRSVAAALREQAAAIGRMAEAVAELAAAVVADEEDEETATTFYLDGSPCQ